MNFSLKFKTKRKIKIMKDENVEKIKEIIFKIAKEMNIEIEKIILFGSRARGDFREDSDYDILIVTKEKLTREKEIEFKVNIRISLARLRIPIDLIVYSSEEFIEKSKDVGYIAYYILEEGLKI